MSVVKVRGGSVLGSSLMGLLSQMFEKKKSGDLTKPTAEEIACLARIQHSKLLRALVDRELPMELPKSEQYVAPQMEWELAYIATTGKVHTKGLRLFDMMHAVHHAAHVAESNERFGSI